jgi:hypothetical protein
MSHENEGKLREIMSISREQVLAVFGERHSSRIIGQLFEKADQGYKSCNGFLPLPF